MAGFVFIGNVFPAPERILSRGIRGFLQQLIASMDNYEQKGQHETS